MDDKEAYAIAYSNIKGSKDKDVPNTAHALRHFKDQPKYRSNKRLGELFDASGETVREFLCYFQLPKSIQKLFDEKKLTQLEQVRRLAQLKNKYPDTLKIIADAANELSGMKSHDTRYVIEYLLHHPGITPKKAREIITQSKTIIESEYFVMTLLTGNEYKILTAEAKKRNMTETKLASEIVRNWLIAGH